MTIETRQDGLDFVSCRYDCSPHALGYIDYCVHFMSRTPTMAPEKLEALKVVISLSPSSS